MKCLNCNQDFSELEREKYCSRKCGLKFNSRKTYQKNREIIIRRAQEWRIKNPEKYLESVKRRTQQMKSKRSTPEFILEKERVKIGVLAHYCVDGIIKCACCGEHCLRLLTIDHINNDGNSHRKSDKGARYLISWLSKNNFPAGFQVLCFSCNWGKYWYGVCPHKKV